VGKLHKFIYVLRSGDIAYMSVDMSKTPPTIKRGSIVIATLYPDEYNAWIDNSVTPTVLGLCTAKQLDNMASKGKSMLKKIQKFIDTEMD
jgi:hypothetical protein